MVEIGPTYALGYPEVDELIANSGGMVSFIEQLSHELETVYGDTSLGINDRYGFADGYKTSEWMACTGSDYRVGKWISSNPDATPTVNGTMFLHEQGKPGTALICNANLLTTIRTATTTAMVLNKLKPDLETLSVIGAGNEGQWHAFTIALLSPQLKRIMFRDIDREQAEGAVEEFEPFAEEVRKRRGIELSVEVAELEDPSVELESETIVTATLGQQEVLSTTQFKGGVILAAVGADMVGKRELGDAIYEQARFVADDLRQSLREGELQYAADQLGVSKEARDSITYHGSLLGGRIIGITNLLENVQAFRDRPEQITVYDSTGFSGQDLAVGRLMIRLLREQDWPQIQFHPPRSDMGFAELMGMPRS